MKLFNGNLIAICTALALIATIATGFVTYGAQGEKVENNKERIAENKKRIEQVEKATLKMYEIDKKQAVMNGAMEEQTKTLDRILKKLDE